MKILLLGAAGFIGTNLTIELAKKTEDEITLVDDSKDIVLDNRITDILCRKLPDDGLDFIKFYLLGSVLFATAVLSFLMKQSQGMEALQMLIGGFVIFMIPQVVGSVAVFLELVAATIRQVWYI